MFLLGARGCFRLVGPDGDRDQLAQTPETHECDHGRAGRESTLGFERKKHEIFLGSVRSPRHGAEGARLAVNAVAVLRRL